MSLSASAVPVLLVGVATLGLTLAVVLRERASLVSLTFLGVGMSISGWLLCYAVIYTTRDPDVALRWVRLMNMHVAWIPTAIYAMALAMIGRLWQARVAVTVACILSALFAVLSLTTNTFVAGVYPHWWGFYARYGWLSFPFLVFFAWLLTLSLRMYWVGYHTASNRTTQRRMKGLAIAFGVAYLGSFDYLPAYGVEVYACGYLPIFVFLMLAARTIWRYRLVEVTPSFAAEHIIAAMTDALLVCDVEGTIRVVNHGACQMLGQAASELVGASVTSLEAGIVSRQQLDVVLKGQPLEPHETVITDRRGQQRILHVAVSTVPGRNGEPDAMVCMARDMTASKRAEINLKRLSVAVEQIADSVIITNVQGVIEYVNPAFERLTGYTKEDALGKTPNLLKSGKMPEEFYQALWQTITAGRVFRGVLINKRKDGRLYFEEKTISPILDDRDCVVHFVSSGEDISERVEAERQLSAKVKELESLNRIMMGREERILDLKQEVQALRARANQPAAERPSQSHDPRGTP